MLKIKLYPVGRKNQIRYRIVVAEARSKRDGKYIESVGFYNPRTEPHTLRLDKQKYDHWIKKGAKPTDTVRHLANQ